MRKDVWLRRRLARIQAQHLVHLEMVGNLLAGLLLEDPDLTYIEAMKINETCGWDLGEVIYEGVDAFEEDPFHAPTRVEAFHVSEDELREIWRDVKGQGVEWKP